MLKRVNGSVALLKSREVLELSMNLEVELDLLEVEETKGDDVMRKTEVIRPNALLLGLEEVEEESSAGVEDQPRTDA